MRQSDPPQDQMKRISGSPLLFFVSLLLLTFSNAAESAEVVCRPRSSDSRTSNPSRAHCDRAGECNPGVARFVCDSGTFTNEDGSFKSNARSLHLVAPERTAFNNAAPANRALARSAIMDGYERDPASPGSSGTTVGDVRRTMLGERGSNERFIGGSSQDRSHRDIESERAGENPEVRRAREERERRAAEEARIRDCARQGRGLEAARAAGLSGDAANRLLCDPLHIPSQYRIRGMPDGGYSGDADAILSSCGRGVLRGTIEGIRGVIHSIPELARLVWRLGASGIRALGEYGEALADAAHAGSMQPLEDFIERRSRGAVEGLLAAVRSLGGAGEAAADRFACLNDNGKTEFICSAMGELLANVAGGEALFSGVSRLGSAAYARAVSAVGRVRGETALARTATTEGAQLARRAEGVAAGRSAAGESAAAEGAAAEGAAGHAPPAGESAGASSASTAHADTAAMGERFTVESATTRPNGRITIRTDEGVLATRQVNGRQILRTQGANGTVRELPVVERNGQVFVQEGEQLRPLSRAEIRDGIRSNNPDAFGDGGRFTSNGGLRNPEGTAPPPRADGAHSSRNPRPAAAETPPEPARPTAELPSGERPRPARTSTTAPDAPVGASRGRNGEIRIRSEDGSHVATTTRSDGTQVLRVRNAEGGVDELMVLETRPGEVPRVRGSDGRVRTLTADDIRAAREARSAAAPAPARPAGAERPTSRRSNASDSGRTAPERPTPAAPRPAEVQREFAGARPHRGFSEDPAFEGRFGKGVRTPSGGTGHMQYSYADREVARAQGRLFENTTVARLPRGRTYTYIVDETGAMSFGDVRDGWEFGVKHAHLAAGRGVLSAGEVAISETGEITYNLSSGSYTRGMIQRGDTTEALLRQRMDRVFAGQTGTPPTYTNATILPEGRVPTPEDLAELCRNPAFRATNGVTFCR